MAFQWLPEDDFLLRKSLEDGTSLETLAKGAVRFSRKFTLSELKDRWHCLLYNPKVTSLSSSVGFELQYGAQFLPQGHYHSIPVRNQYYTARKKRRLELEESPPLHPRSRRTVHRRQHPVRSLYHFGIRAEDPSTTLRVEFEDTKIGAQDYHDHQVVPFFTLVLVAALVDHPSCFCPALST